MTPLILICHYFYIQNTSYFITGTLLSSGETTGVMKGNVFLSYKHLILEVSLSKSIQNMNMLSFHTEVIPKQAVWLS